MSKIVYFVVGVDLDAKSPFIDDDTFVARFADDEQVYDDITGEWSHDYNQEGYNEALQILNTKPIAKDGN